jgi:carbonic anhydrase
VTSLPRRLVEGYAAFVAGRLPRETERLAELAETGQRPEIMVIGCCDSRVSPEVIFDARPGELFVVRNVGNLVPPYAPDGRAHGVSAALEFAVMALKVKHIVVLGHARCGGVAAAADEGAPLSPGDFIGQWIKLLDPAKAAAGPQGALSREDFLTRLEHEGVKLSLANLMTFPCVNILAGRGKLTLHGAYFGVATGVLSVLDRATGAFRPLPGAARRAFAATAAE